ncbi:unnamed protein product, partial [Tetraodon nigroviridis]
GQGEASARGTAMEGDCLSCIKYLMFVFNFLIFLFCPGSPSAGGLLPVGSGRVGAGGSHRIQGNHSGQPPAVHRRLRHPGIGRHAVSAGLPGLLRSHSRKQMSPSLFLHAHPPHLLSRAGCCHPGLYFPRARRLMLFFHPQ